MGSLPKRGSDTKPKRKYQHHTKKIKHYNISPKMLWAYCGVLGQPVLADWAQRAPRILSGIGVMLQQVKRPQTHTHALTKADSIHTWRLLCFSSEPIVFYTEQQRDTFVCQCTRRHKWCLWKGECLVFVWSLCWLCDSDHTVLCLLRLQYVLFRNSSLYRHNPGLHLGTCEDAQCVHHSICTKTEHDIPAVIVNCLKKSQSDSLLNYKTLKVMTVSGLRGWKAQLTGTNWLNTINKNSSKKKQKQIVTTTKHQTALVW